MHPQHYTYIRIGPHIYIVCLTSYFRHAGQHFAVAARTIQKVEQCCHTLTTLQRKTNRGVACGKPFLTAEFMATCKYYSWSETSFLRQPLRHSKDETTKDPIPDNTSPHYQVALLYGASNNAVLTASALRPQTQGHFSSPSHYPESTQNPRTGSRHQ